MKNNLPKWVREQGKILQEVSQDISWYGSKLLDKAKKIDISKIPVIKHRDFAQEQETEPTIAQTLQIPNAWEEEQELREKLDWAIHRAYYKEGGFRYFGSNLKRYVNVTLPAQTDLLEIWTAGYNSCIQPMLYQLEKLEKELDGCLPPSGRANLGLKNELLLEKMQKFRQLAYEQKLHTQTDLSLEAYKQALRCYATELDAQLLTPFCPRTDP